MRLFWHLLEFQVSSCHCARIIGVHGADEAFSGIKNYCSTSTKRRARTLFLYLVNLAGLIELQVRDEPYWRSIKAVVPTLLGGGALLSLFLTWSENNGHTKRPASVARKCLVASAGADAARNDTNDTSG